ncbi:MAG: TonB family protein, partial [Caldimonas sp.]
APPAPPAPKAAPAPPAPPAPVAKPPAVVTAGVACSNFRSKMGEAAYPRRARHLGIDHGEALIQFTLKPDGRVTAVRALSATHPVFARASMQIVEQFKCMGQGQDVVVLVPFGYRLK